MKQPDKSEFLTPPPSLMKALTAGFDAISNHVWLVAFTLILDLILWVGPRFRIYSLLQELLAQQPALTSVSNADMIESLQEMVRKFQLIEQLTDISYWDTEPDGYQGAGTEPFWYTCEF